MKMISKCWMLAGMLAIGGATHASPGGEVRSAVEKDAGGGATLVFPDQHGFVEVAAQGAPQSHRNTTTADEIAAILKALADGPTQEQRAAGARALFPEGTRVAAVSLSKSNVAEIRLDLPAATMEALRSGDYNFEHLVHGVEHNLEAFDLSGFTLKGFDEEVQDYLPLGFFEPAPAEYKRLNMPDVAVAPSRQEDAPRLREFTRIAPGQIRGSLSDRVVHLNAGHGWTYRSAGNWSVQRTFVHNNLEDMSNADLVHQYVTRYLRNAGAEVFTVREEDPNPNMVIVDNGNSAPDYEETGSWFDSSLAGFPHDRETFLRSDNTAQTENPFDFGTNRLAQCVVGAPTATATWTPTIPEDGYYNVYVSHAAFTNRAPQAHYRINHAGGFTDYYIDQRRYRFTWIFLGRYYFDAGRNPSEASVVLTNSSTSADHYVSADAVRFGGGIGLIDRNSNGTSGYARYDEEAVYHMQFSGAPTTVHQRNSTNDESAGWSGRPRFADWLRTNSTAYGAPAQQHVALANHTNATANGTARGIISILYSGYENTIHDRFRRAVHDQIVHNLTQGYGGDYVVNSNPLRSGQYGENNPNNSGGIPIFLGEWLFHDNSRDMALYHDPKFRRMMARGIYQGIVKFFEAEYGGPGALLPEPPRNFRARALDSTSVRLDWQAPPVGPSNGYGDAATGYVVYQSTHGRGFAPGTPVSQPTTTISGLQPGTTYYFSVAATNAGGISFPTETLMVRTAEEEAAPRVLAVSGFDKTDIATRVRSSYGGGTLYRQFTEQMNNYDYLVEHGRAIDATGAAVRADSAEHDAINAGLVALADYDAVLWSGGLQAEVSSTDPTDDAALPAGTRNALATYLAQGGRLFISGSSVAWDLNRLGQAAFLSNQLGAAFVQQTSGFNDALKGSDSIFGGVSPFAFGTGPQAAYAVYETDVLNPHGGAIPALRFLAGSGANTIESFDSIGGWRDPNFSGQTNADDASTFQIVSSPAYAGAGSGALNYIWGAGDFIRLYNSALTEFPAASDFGIWVRGDGSGNRLRICLRDSDNGLLVNEWTVLNFTGWRQIVWEDIANNPGESWPTAGPGSVEGPNVRFDSLHLEKLGVAASGTIYLDEATATSTETGPSQGPVAAIQYDNGHRVVMMSIPFEAIVGEDARTSVMGSVLDFLLQQPQPPTMDAWLVQ